MKQTFIILFALISQLAIGQLIDEPYVLSLKVDEADSKACTLVVSIELAPGCHFVSPYSSDRFSGRFNIDIEDSAHLEMTGSFTESPRSVEEYDSHPFVDGLVNWVRVNTTYRYELTVLTNEENFEATGWISFTIEPRCTMEEIQFIISSKKGKLSVRTGSGC